MSTLRARLAQWLGYGPCLRPHLPDDPQLALAKAITAEMNVRFAGVSGDYKRREALRMLLNIHPHARERDLNLLIELALQ